METFIPTLATPDYQSLGRPLQFTSAAASKVRELVAEEGNAALKLRAAWPLCFVHPSPSISHFLTCRRTAACGALLI